MKKSELGKTVYLEMGVWYNEEQGSIHLAAKGVEGFHTTVNANDESKRGHPNLFMKLARCLRDAGAPYPKDKLYDLEGA
tara:strand:- start:48 stop:284 length:237 start_codon:yes stop_codon:yes gene_type:complete